MGGTIHIRQGRWLVIIYRLDKRSRMNREIHVWICGSVGVKFPCATRLYFESESAPRDCDIATANSFAEYLILRPQFINFSATLRLNHMILNPKQTQLVLVRLKARLFRILLFQPFFSLLD